MDFEIGSGDNRGAPLVVLCTSRLNSEERPLMYYRVTRPSRFMGANEQSRRVSRGLPASFTYAQNLMKSAVVRTGVAVWSRTTM